VQFGADLIKEHGAENARSLFIEAVVEFDGPHWAAQASHLFDNMCVPVADGSLTIVDGGMLSDEQMQALAMATLSGELPSNASKPGAARDMLMNAIKPPTETRQ
jgi:hypothetical protein